MDTVEKTPQLRQQIAEWRKADETVVLVPTMGNLHEGHLSLVKKAKDLGQRIVVSLFVNPTQFVEGEDFDQYPRTLAADQEKLAPLGVDVLFMPSVAEVYPNGLKQLTQVSVPSLDGIFCGASRPGHFTGVATVVTKLFNLVQPDVAVFGQKDYQQLLVIKRLVADLNLPVEVIGEETVRETDGLAMSSRNQYLNESERGIAPNLYRILCEAEEKIGQGVENYRELEKKCLSKLESHGFIVDYLGICNADDLSTVGNGSKARGNLVILAAAWLGQARLIDNVLLKR